MKRYMRYKIALIIVLALVFISPGVFAQGYGGGRGPGPYGGYCEGMRWGWYGARQPVSTADDARKRLEKFYEGRDVVIADVVEQRMFFRANIKDRDGKLLDQVIIHKRSGRIRSVY